MSTTPAPITFRVDAGERWVKIATDLDTLAEAEALAAKFAKSTRIKATTLYCADHVERGYLVAEIKLAADDANGGRNETGIKRVRSILRTIEAMGGVLDFRQNVRGGAKTREEFEALLAGEAPAPRCHDCGVPAEPGVVATYACPACGARNPYASSEAPARERFAASAVPEWSHASAPEALTRERLIPHPPLKGGEPTEFTVMSADGTTLGEVRASASTPGAWLALAELPEVVVTAHRSREAAIEACAEAVRRVELLAAVDDLNAAPEADRTGPPMRFDHTHEAV